MGKACDGRQGAAVLTVQKSDYPDPTGTMGMMRLRGRRESALIALAWCASAMAARVEVSPPVRTELDLPLVGARIEGGVTAWDERTVWVVPRGADEPEPIAWMDVDPEQAYRLWTRLMDKSSGASWLYLGIAMLEVGEAARADRAFAQAARMDPGAKALAERIREAHAAGEDARALVEPPPQEQPPPEAATEARDKPRPTDDGLDLLRAAPWPEQTAEQRARNVETLRAEAREMVRKSGLTRIKEVETEYFLFFTDLSPSEVKRWAKVLDGMYRTLIHTLEMPEDALLFHGKCVIFIFNARHDFITFEDKAFGFDAQRAGGVCHMRGPSTFVCFERGSDDARFQSVLVHETVHAFMHRYRSPAQLPTWANEGLADYVAGVLTPMSNEPREHWLHARQFAQSGKDAGAIMRQTYRDGSWFTEDSYPVSHMLVRFMLTHKPRAFKEWIDDIKSGAEWDASMKERFGVTPDVLARGFADAIKSERKFTTAR